MEQSISKRNFFNSFLKYFLIVFLIAIVCAAVFFMVKPDLTIDFPNASTDGIRAYLAVASIITSLLSPIYAAIRYWHVKEYCTASLVAHSLFLGNIGYAIPFVIVSFIIFYGAQRLWQLFLFYQGK